MDEKELAKFLFDEIDNWAFAHKFNDEGYDDVCVDGYVNLEEIARNIIKLYSKKVENH